MKKLLFLCLLVGWFKVAAQNERRVLKEAVDQTVGQLKQHSDVLLAHPLLLNQEGEESAGFTDLVIAKPKDGVSEASLAAVFHANNLEERPNRAAPDVNSYLA